MGSGIQSVLVFALIVPCLSKFRSTTDFLNENTKQDFPIVFSTSSENVKLTEREK